MTFEIGILLDLICAVVLIVFISHSARRGFVRTVVELIGWVLIMYIAFTLSQPLSQSIYDHYLDEPVRTAIADAVQGSMADTAAETSARLWESLPGFVRVGFGLTQSGLQTTVENAISGGEAAITAGLMTDIVSPLAVTVIRWTIITLLFTVGFFIVRVVAKWLNTLFKLPIVGGINRFLGGVVGFLKGSIVLLVGLMVLSVLLTLFPEGIGPVDHTLLDTSYVYSFVSSMKVFSF